MINMLEQTLRQIRGWQRLSRTISAVALCAISALAPAAASSQKSFKSPEASVHALVQAVKSNDWKRLRLILGPHSEKLVYSGDEVADAKRRATFIKAYNEANKIVPESDTKATLVIGVDEWPLPIPLVKSGSRWRFDLSEGRKEILARRIGANELAAIEVCLAIVDAQREYAALDHPGGGVPTYAARFLSTSGNHDGLYWETQPNESSSPLGPLLAAAANEGYSNSQIKALAPYHGYYYRILTSQGSDAPGGAYDYLIQGKMIGGFAIFAYPARYGASGVTSFMVNHDGEVYEKNLGKTSTEDTTKITSFNPDASWKKQ